MAGAFPDISVRVLQRSVIWWIWKTENKCAAAIHSQLLAVFGQDTYSVQSVRTWLRSFHGGCDRIHDLARSGRPVDVRTQENIEAVVEAVQADRRQTVDQIALRVNLSHTSVQRIIRGDLQYRKKAAKLVPHVLSDHNRRTRVSLAQDALDWIRDEPGLMRKVITGDESYIHIYMEETKERSREWLDKNEDRPQKAVRGWGTKYSKCMLVLFFDFQGVVYRQFVRGQMITGEVYLGILDNLLQAIQYRHTRLWRSGLFVLHQDNASAHTCDDVQRWLGCRYIRILDHPSLQS